MSAGSHIFARASIAAKAASRFRALATGRGSIFRRRGGQKSLARRRCSPRQLPAKKSAIDPKPKKMPGGRLMLRKPALASQDGHDPTTSEDISTWMGLRDELVAQMNREGTWQPMFGPMLAEVAQALRMAAKLRDAAEDELFVKSQRSGRSYIHPGVAAADIEVRRAALLLQRVNAMVKSRVAAEEPEEDPDDPFAELDAETQLDPDPHEDDARIRRRMKANLDSNRNPK